MTFTERLSAVVAAYGSPLWYGVRFGAEAAAAFAVDQETALADYAVVPCADGRAFDCVGGVKPTRPEPQGGFFGPKTVAVALAAWIGRPGGRVRLSERWAAVVSGRRLNVGGGRSDLADDVGRADDEPAAPGAAGGWAAFGGGHAGG